MATIATTIRPAREDDVAPLAEAFGWQVETIAHRWKAVECGEDEMYLAEVQGRPVASVSVNVSNDIPDLLHLFALGVAPYLQRRGLGTALILRAEEEARDRGLAGVWLDVEVANEDARRLYERIGYRVEGGTVTNRYTAQPSGEPVEEVCHRLYKRFAEKA